MNRRPFRRPRRRRPPDSDLVGGCCANDHARRSRHAPVVCGQFPFPAALLDERRFDERADTPEAEALRAHLAMVGPDYDWLPDDGWALVGADEVGPSTWPSATTVPWSMRRCHSELGWRVDGWGDCQPADGARRWDRACDMGTGARPGHRPRDHDIRCARHRASLQRRATRRWADRGPRHHRGRRLGACHLRRPGAGGDQTCPGNPSTRVTVTLPEPLGDRQLVDGSTTPPRVLLPTDSPLPTLSTVEGVAVLNVSGRRAIPCRGCAMEVLIAGMAASLGETLCGRSTASSLRWRDDQVTLNPGDYNVTVRDFAFYPGPNGIRERVEQTSCAAPLTVGGPGQISIEVTFAAGSCRIEVGS